MNSVCQFYDGLAASYHLLFEDWDRSIARQADALAGIIYEEWSNRVGRVLDVACGIGTQAIGLAEKGFRVVASDLSPAAINRARQEATARGLAIDFSICDMRACHERFGGNFDLVMACDNSVPHLLSEAEILDGLRQMHDCLRPAGGVLLTVRDYAAEPRRRGIFKPYGVREVEGRRIVAFQIWDFEGDCYDLTLYLVADSGQFGAAETHVYRTRYYAINPDRLCQLMAKAGFTGVKRRDDVFYQPVLLGTRP